MGASVTKKCYQLRSNIAKDEKGDLVADCPSILARWRDHFSQLQSAHGRTGVRQTAIHTAEPLARDHSAFEVEMAIERLKRCICSRC